MKSIKSRILTALFTALLVFFSSAANARVDWHFMVDQQHSQLTATVPVVYNRPNSRHYAKSVKQGSTTKEKNTVIMPGVDVNADVVAINSGLVQKVNDTFTVNGRTYGHHDGTLYPMEGKGFYLLGRGAFNALGVYNDFGNTAKAEQIITNMKIIDSEKKIALEIWKKLQ
jgi:hypothetical protein